MSYDSVEVFRTRRYADSQLESEAEVYGFEIVDSWICEYGHSKVVLFKRK
jgi:hypothetical protein